jgi:hypothetical protein
MLMLQWEVWFCKEININLAFILRYIDTVQYNDVGFCTLEINALMEFASKGACENGWT